MVSEGWKLWRGRRNSTKWWEQRFGDHEDERSVIRYGKRGCWVLPVSDGSYFCLLVQPFSFFFFFQNTSFYGGDVCSAYAQVFPISCASQYFTIVSMLCWVSLVEMRSYKWRCCLQQWLDLSIACRDLCLTWLCPIYSLKESKMGWAFSDGHQCWLKWNLLSTNRFYRISGGKCPLVL